MSGGFFICYRHEDSAAWADRIGDWLKSRGHGLATSAREASVFVLLIGKVWDATVLSDPNDPVRLAIEAAIERRIRLIPVLVEGASMPPAGALPESLKVLTALHPIRLSSGRFDAGIEQLDDFAIDKGVNLSGGGAFPVPGIQSHLRVTGAIGPPGEQKSARKPAAKTAGAKTVGAKKSAAKKRAARKAVAKKAAPKSAARKSAPKKAALKKATAKKTTATKSPAKSTVAKKAVRKGASKKSVAKTFVAKTGGKKTPLKKSPTRKAGKTAAAVRPSGFFGQQFQVSMPQQQQIQQMEQQDQQIEPKRPINKDLSVDEMKEFASARRSARPAKDQPLVSLAVGPSATPTEDMVDCSVFGPPTAPPGGTALIQVFLHLANQAKRAKDLAARMDSAATIKATKALDLAVRRGATIDIAFAASGLTVDEPVQSVVWRGEPAYCQFLVAIPAGAGGQNFFPVVRVSVDGKLIGRIAFSLSSGAVASQPASEPLGDHAGPYKYAFVSYASKDREEVLKRVQMLEVMKTQFFQDILSLDPGDRWENKLYENIDRCDLFLLFWSKAAKDSKWVIREAEYALRRRDKKPDREPDLVPVVLEQNVLPPESLSALHFNDRVGYLIERKS
jgi:TIR domain/Histone H1-like nucleoprotein HC2